MNNTILSALLKSIDRSTHKRHMTGCVIVNRKNKILSNGCSHSSSFRLNELHSIHAEIHALGRGRHEDLDRAIAYIGTKARKSGNVVNSAPCLTCAIALRAAGIFDVFYTIGENEFKYLNLEDDLSHLKIYPRRTEIL